MWLIWYQKQLKVIGRKEGRNGEKRKQREIQLGNRMQELKHIVKRVEFPKSS